MLDKNSLTFLQDLKIHNNRDWFADNKKRYETALKQPAIDFADTLALQLGAALGQPMTHKIFRIHRDVRFSKDKTPYNAHLHIGFSTEDAGKDTPAFMFGLEPDSLVLGMGTFAFSPDGLKRWRDAVSGQKGEELNGLLKQALHNGARLSDPDLKRVPPPYLADHPRADLLRHKGLAVWLDQSATDPAFGETGPEFCTRHLLTLKPIYDWMVAN